MRKRKGCFYSLRMLVLLSVFLILCLYYIIPSYTLSSPVVFKRLEKLCNQISDDIQFSSGTISWQTLANFSVKNLSLKILGPDKTKTNICCKTFHILLPPESFFAHKMPFNKKNMTAALFSASGINTTYEKILISDASFKGNLFLHKTNLLNQNISPFDVDFQSHFRIAAIQKDTYILKDINGVVKNVPQKRLSTKGSFLWKGSPFMFIHVADPQKQEFYLIGDDVNLEDFISPKLKASGFFKADISARMENDQVTHFVAVFHSSEEGLLTKFNFYDITQFIPLAEKEKLAYVIDSFQKYTYSQAEISFTWKDNTFFTDFNFQNKTTGDERHITVPVHIDGNVPEFIENIELDIFPVFLKELSGIIGKLVRKKE